ncbi:MAG: transcriptional repressor, partial [Acidimicrobiia bacterium]|nr:transcriptional repressor [Acidimicrobiia bacterium]
MPDVKSPAELTEVFRAQGLKVTPQRLAVFEALLADADHPTAEAVYERVVSALPTVSLRT